jgi:hypothetical protein
MNLVRIMACIVLILEEFGKLEQALEGFGWKKF